MPVHLHGGMADMDAIPRIADAHGLAGDRGCRAGARRRVPWPTRRQHRRSRLLQLLSRQEPGCLRRRRCVVTDNRGARRAAAVLRDWGQREQVPARPKGFNYRMESAPGRPAGGQAAPSRGAGPRRAAGTPPILPTACRCGHRPARETPGTRHVYPRLRASELPDRTATQERLARAGIATGIHYPVPVHLQPAYADLGYRRGDFPIAERFAAIDAVAAALPGAAAASRSSGSSMQLCAEPVPHHGLSAMRLTFRAIRLATGFRATAHG